jgi:hypothetical protein
MLTSATSYETTITLITGWARQSSGEVHYAKKQMKVLMNNNCEL